MIRLFPEDATEEQFKTNGIAVLDSGIKDNSVEWTKNGMYSFDFDYFSEEKYSGIIKGDMIVVAPTPLGEQPFRIHKVTKQIGFLKVECYHLFYDLASNLIEDSNFVNSTGTALMDRFNAAFQYPTSFRFTSDIDKVANCRMVRMNPVQALLDTSKDNTFLNRWGGVISRDGYDVKMLKSMGEDRGFKITHGKNLTGYTYQIDWEPMATRIMPIGFDGLMLPEKYVDSPLIDKYKNIKIKTVNYQDVKAKNSNSQFNQEGAIPVDQAYEKLRSLAKEEYSKNEADKPSINIKVQFKNLGDTKEYSQFKKLVDVKPLDIVHIKVSDFDIKDSIIGYKYDALAREYIEVELGTIARTGISDKTVSTESKVTNVETKVDETNTNLNETNVNLTETNKNVVEIQNDIGDLESTAKQAQERIDKVKQDVANTQSDMTKVMNNGGNNKIEWSPNLMNATQMKIHTSYGYWLLDDAGAGFHSNNGTVMNGLSADGRIYADSITGNTLTGTTINGGNINGGIINGAQFVAGSIKTKSHAQFLNSAGQVSTSVASYGISTPALTVDGNIDRAIHANIQYLHVSGNISGNGSGLYLQGPVYVDGKRIGV
ncbi:hypothetical protein C5L30_000231 [Companilactobacillus farciminis]|uniref:Tail spike domain-containing protein n=1 Tax=Companilactobacillus farciminis TaxID=1612 RepID=A0A4R5NIV2_9LACO|nr:phage tail spike protein [Companilactobacillus farciminis]ATO46114.1 hypothetical protein LF20184_04820 [Companilactobacillus farciminis KCTC 3681 = DSM 20184]KRK62499.1 Phage endopeptidase [Companilactobacillus farciminis KCTC 3681 = DSM 20184]TDG74515.1 hypothetical protein C5L30_000231 [Companilactobacillus farciminis]